MQEFLESEERMKNERRIRNQRLKTSNQLELRKKMKDKREMEREKKKSTKTRIHHGLVIKRYLLGVGDSDLAGEKIGFLLN